MLVTKTCHKIPSLPSNWDGFILCGTQSTKKSPTWYITYAIVDSVSIPTCKKCYSGAIFEFSENHDASRKKFFTMSRSFVLLTFWNGIFSVTAQVPCHSCFSKKNECTKCQAVFVGTCTSYLTSISPSHFQARPRCLASSSLVAVVGRCACALPRAGSVALLPPRSICRRSVLCCVPPHQNCG